MSMYDTKKADALDGRMEKILRLKEFEKNNHIHMNSISDIMGYERTRDSVYDTDGQINTDISKNQRNNTVCRTNLLRTRSVLHPWEVQNNRIC